MTKYALRFFKFFSALVMCISGMATAACPPPGIDITSNPPDSVLNSVQVGMNDAGTEAPHIGVRPYNFLKRLDKLKKLFLRSCLSCSP